MGNFWRQVNQVIEEADVLIVVLDSRFIEETRNIEIERKVKWRKKPLIYCLTKCDLVDKDELEKRKDDLVPSVFISAKEHLGTTLLRERILIEAKRAGLGKEVTVGVLGYPNVGKSSLINVMKGRASAKAGSASGVTKTIQKVRGDSRIVFLDTPGVIPYQEKDALKHAATGTVDFGKVRDPDLAVMGLMEHVPGKIEAFYGVPVCEDMEVTLELIARKKHVLKKGNEPDLPRVARIILKDWQKGLIK